MPLKFSRLHRTSTSSVHEHRFIAHSAVTHGQSFEENQLQKPATFRCKKLPCTVFAGSYYNALGKRLVTSVLSHPNSIPKLNNQITYPDLLPLVCNQLHYCHAQK